MCQLILFNISTSISSRGFGLTHTWTSLILLKLKLILERQNIMIMRILVGSIIIVVAAVGYQMFKDRDIPLEDLKAKYSYPDSQFIEVDGIKFHVLDEGNKAGEVVVLIHGHFGSLHMYDGWVDILKKDYRVVRFRYNIPWPDRP